MTDHTPGPWSAFIRGKVIAIDVGPRPTGRRPSIVDWMGFDGNDQPHRRNVANARLIAKAPDMHAALRLALPVMRRTATEYLEGVMVNNDPASIAPSEWDEIRPDIEAIIAAEACVGRTPDDYGWLDAIIDGGRWREQP